MSKIARIYQGLNEIQKYYQDGVLQKLFFDWKHYIGTELNIEYGKECAGRNVVINGKTYQNLVINLDELVGNVYTRDTVAIIDTSLFKANTTYTAIITISESNYSYEKYGAIFSIFYPTLTNGYVSISLKDGTFKLKFTTKEETPSKIQVGVQYENSASSSFKLNNLIVLEGDYTSIDLPDNINEIESIGEREIEDNNLISEMIVGWCNIATGNLEGCPESYPNSKVSNLIEINPNIKYKSNILSRTTGTDNLRIRCFDENKNYVRFTTEEEQGLCDFNDFYNYKNTYKSIKYIRILVLNSSLEVEEPYVVKGNINRFTYPVTIRNYNYKCETDGIVLPNGVKNSIDTIDGKKVHVQRVEKIIITKQKDVTKFGTTSSTYGHGLYFINSDIYGEKGKCNNTEIGVISNKFIGIADCEWNYSKKINCCFMNINGTVHFLVDKTEFPSRETFNDWLEKNEVTVHYPLAEPIYTYLESGLYDDITLPDGTKNEISYNGENHIHTRKIDKVIFDGSNDENWGTSGLTPQTETIIFQTAIIANTVISNSSLLCNIYGTLPDFSTDNIEGIIMGGTNNTILYVRIKRSNLETEDINGFKAYLSENPLEVYYELAEPVISELPFSDITYKLNEPLRSLPNRICDTIEENKLVQRVGKVVLDGNEDWIFQSCDTNGNGILNIYFIIQDLKVKEKQFIICDKYIQQNTTIVNTTNEGVFVNEEKRLYLRLFTSKATTVEEAKEYIKDNPFVVYYELATPIETGITPDKILINGEPITDTVGIELPDGTCDSIENDYYVKRVEKIIFDENIKHYQTLMIVNNNVIIRTRKFSMAIGDSNIISNATVISWMHDKNNLEEVTETKIMAISSVSGWNEANIIIPSSYFEGDITIEVVKEFLAENPVIMYYELATPIKIPLFSIKEGLTTLKSTNNITPQIELSCLVRDKFQNMCPNTWVNGDIAIATGDELSSSTSRIKLQDYIAVQPNTTYYCDTFSETVYSTTEKVGVRYYKNDKTYISGGGIGIAKTSYIKFTTPEDCYYIKFIVETLDTNYKMYLRPVK